MYSQLNLLVDRFLSRGAASILAASSSSVSDSISSASPSRSRSCSSRPRSSSIKSSLSDVTEAWMTTCRALFESGSEALVAAASGEGMMLPSGMKVLCECPGTTLTLQR